MQSYIKERDILIVILLSMVTCGIYPIILFFTYGEELQQEARRHNTEVQLTDPVVAFLLGIVTCGIYYYYYVYKQSQVLEELGKFYGIQTLDPVVLLLLSIFISYGIGNYVNVYYSSKIATEMLSSSNNFTSV